MRAFLVVSKHRTFCALADKPLTLCHVSDEAIARAQYHLALVIKAIPDYLNAEREKEAVELINTARETRRKITHLYLETLTPAEELKSFGFLVSLLAGRWIG